MDNSHDSNEPVAWAVQTDDCLLPADAISWVETQRHTVPLYTRPQSITPLTDEQINQIEKHGEFWIDGTPLQFARAIEAKLKEKNNG